MHTLVITSNIKYVLENGFKQTYINYTYLHSLTHTHTHTHNIKQTKQREIKK